MATIHDSWEYFRESLGGKFTVQGDFIEPHDVDMPSLEAILHMFKGFIDHGRHFDKSDLIKAIMFAIEAEAVDSVQTVLISEDARPLLLQYEDSMSRRITVDWRSDMDNERRDV